MKKLTRNLSIMLILTLLLSTFPCTERTASAATTKLSAKSITMKVGETKTIKLLNSKKKAKWSIEDEKIEVISETKKQIKFKAVDYGTTKIYAMVGKKKYKCKITIKKGQNPIPVPTLQPAPKPTAIPTTSPTIKPTVTPTLVPKNKLIYKDENVSITYTGISGEEDDYNINFLIENTSDRTLEIQVRETSINGFMVDPICSMEIAKGKKIIDSMSISYDNAKLIPMSKVENIETKFCIFNWDDSDFGYDTENVIILGNASDSTNNVENRPIFTATPKPTAVPKPTVVPTATPEPTINPSPATKENNIEILAEYTLSKSASRYKRHFIVIKNNSSETVDASTSSLAYASDGTMVGAKNSQLYALGAGCISVLCEAFETSSEIGYYETQIKSSPSKLYKSVIQDLSYVQNNIEKGAVFQVTNNGTEAAKFVKGYILFFQGDELVDYVERYFTDNESEIKSGETISKQITTYNDFDRIEFYLTGRRSIE